MNMNLTSFSLVVKSPNDKIPSQNIMCECNWKVFDLKQYLSEVYPGNPPPHSQRIIHAGKLLKDDTPVKTLFKDDSPQTVHLVCRNAIISPSKDTSEKKNPSDAVSDLPPEELEKLQQGYFEYLQQYYMQNGTSYQSTGHAFSMPWPSYAPSMTGNWPSWNPYMTGTWQTAPTTASQTNTPPAVNVDDGRNRFFRDARSVLAGLGMADPAEREQPVAAPPPVAPQPVEAAAPQQQAMMVGNPMGGGMMGADELAENGNLDLVDRFYMIFRLGLFLGLCFVYSSLDKAIIVFSVAAYVYFYNIYRRRRHAAAVRQDAAAIQAQRQANRQQQPDQQQEQQQQQPPQDGTSSTPPSNEASSSGSQDPTSSSAHPSTPPVPSDSANSTNPPAGNDQGTARFANILRLVASTSYQFISSLLTSIIPEQPPPQIRLD